MKISKLAVLVLLAVFIISLIVLAPARLIYRFLPENSPLQLSNLSGSIWRGNAQQVIYQNQNLGNLDWRLKPTAVLTAKRGSHFTLRHPDYLAEGTLKAGSDNLLILNDTTVRIRADRLPLEGIASAVKANGVVNADIESLTLRDQKIDQIQARIHWKDASISAPVELELGEVIVDAEGENGNINALIKSSTSSQLDIDGKVALDPAMQYRADIKIKSKPDTPEEVTNILPLLGQKDSDGAVRLISNGVVPR